MVIRCGESVPAAGPLFFACPKKRGEKKGHPTAAPLCEWFPAGLIQAKLRYSALLTGDNLTPPCGAMPFGYYALRGLRRPYIFAC